MKSPITFLDSYTAQPSTRRERLIEEVRRLKMLSWADPSDRDLKEQIADAERELLELDLQQGGGS